MGIVSSSLRFASSEIEALLKLDKKAHMLIVYGISHTRRTGRKLLKRASDMLDVAADLIE